MQTLDNLTQNAFDDLSTELRRARREWPDNGHLLAALMEEVGELSQAMLQQQHEPSKGITADKIYMEAIQVAVMALRVCTEGDSTFPIYRPMEGFWT